MTQLALALLASSTESKKSGPIGLAVILILCVACYFLFKSMSRHMRKVRDEFPGTPGPAAPSDERAGDAVPTADQGAPEQAETVTHPADPPSNDLSG